MCVRSFGDVATLELDEIGPDQMVNQAIEITLAEAGADYELVRYDLPEPDTQGT